MSEQHASYQRGCKITAGARPTLSGPTLRHAKILVASSRASARIVAPAAATLIERAWRKVKAERAEWQAVLSAMTCVRERTAATRIVRTWRSIKAARVLRSLVPVVTLISAHLRGHIARAHLRARHSAALLIQTAWRMVRSKLLCLQLAGAAARLHHGVTLAKYRATGATHERHDRFVWLSEDKQRLCWAAGTARSEKAARSVQMSAITAVSKGVQTQLMKKMARRAEPPKHESLPRKVAKRVDLLGAPLPLNSACAFSVMGEGRAVDFVAKDADTQIAWLRDLRTILTYGHHLEHTAAVDAIQAGGRRGSLAAAA